jgi:hypothetical protein
VNHVSGTFTICAATGSALRSPMTGALAPRCRAHAVVTAPVAHAAKISAIAPSANMASSVCRSEPGGPGSRAVADGAASVGRRPARRAASSHARDRRAICAAMRRTSGNMPTS